MSSNRIKALRKELHMTQKSFADYIGTLSGISISKQYISAVEHGRKHLRTDIYIALSKDCRVSVDYMLCRCNCKKSYHYSPTLSYFGSRLRSLRKDHHLSMHKLSDSLIDPESGKALSLMEIYKIETEKLVSKYPPISTITHLADFFSVPVDYFLSLTDETIIHT